MHDRESSSRKTVQVSNFASLEMGPFETAVYGEQRFALAPREGPGLIYNPHECYAVAAVGRPMMPPFRPVSCGRPGPYY